MKAVEAIALLLLLATVVSVAVGRGVRKLYGWRVRERIARRPWTVATDVVDGSLVVRVVRGREGHTIAVLPSGMESVDYQSDLRLALEDGEAEADILNQASRASRGRA